MFCLPKFASKTFKEKLKSGVVNPDRLVEMSSAERRSFFSKHFGTENAKNLNVEFEKKLLLKNQQQGIINWAKSVSGIKPEVRRTILDKVNKMTDILQPKELDKFLSDVVEQRLGTQVTVEEAGKIAKLAQNVSQAKASMQSGGNRIEYGKAKVALDNYVAGLKNASAPTLKEKGIVGIASDIAGTTKGLNASLDNSAIFRQGWKTMFTNPAIWQKNARRTFSDIVKQFGGKRVVDEIQAEIQSRPTYDLMQKAKLDVGTTEEQFPNHIAEKLPLLGRAYKASEAAYTGFVYRTRADVFDKTLKIAETAGIDVTDKTQLASIGKMVNALTGRGYLGKGEQIASTLNNFFFSPKFFKSQIDFLTAHQLQKGVTPFVRKQAAKNLLKMVVGSASILAIADALMPGSVEWDPRSSDFGKIRIGSTRFDMTGGTASIATLAARLATMSTKSSTTGKISKLNTGKFGSQTGVDVLTNFAEGKLSPVAGVVRDLLKGQTFDGKKPTVLGETSQLLTPLPVKNAYDLYKSKNGANLLLGTIADSLGISTNTYEPK